MDFDIDRTYRERKEVFMIRKEEVMVRKRET